MLNSISKLQRGLSGLPHGRERLGVPPVQAQKQRVHIHRGRVESSLWCKNYNLPTSFEILELTLRALQLNGALYSEQTRPHQTP